MNGMTMSIFGAAIALIGAMFSVTLLGAIIGIPLVIIGFVVLFKGKTKYSEERRSRYEQRKR